MDRLDQARAYATTVNDQNVELMADELRVLLRDNPAFLKALNQMLNVSNTHFAAEMDTLPKPLLHEAMLWVCPLARIGMVCALQAMDRKYGAAAEGGGE